MDTMDKSTIVESGYAAVNDLEMYYEIHGPTSTAHPPLVLLHGGLLTIDTSFATVLPTLAQTRQVIAVEQQAHGHTADINRPLTFEQEADDTAAALRHLNTRHTSLGGINIEKADIFGFSDGGNVALGLAIRHPQLVRKLVIIGTNYHNDGLHPGMVEGMANMKPEDLDGTGMKEAYTSVAPNPHDWPKLIQKVVDQAIAFQGWSAEQIQAIKAPTLLIIGDSDIIRPEHAVEMFRLHGGGVAGDMVGLPNSQLAVLPGTNHFGLMQRADRLLPMVIEFLDAPMPKVE